MTTYHHHIAAYYLRLAAVAMAEGSIKANFYFGQAFLYSDFA